MTNLLALIPGFKTAIPSVSKILETFHTVVNQLEDAATAQKAKAEAEAEVIRLALQRQTEAEAEVKAAEVAVQNIRALIGVVQ